MATLTPPRRTSDLIRQWGEIEPSTLRRWKSAGKRLSIYRDEWRDMIEEKITEQTHSPKRAAQMRRFSSTTVNLLKAITDACVTAYGAGCRRFLRGAPENVAVAFARLVRESGFELNQHRVAVAAWLAGPTFVLPYYNEGESRICVDIATPDRVDAEWRTGGRLARLLVRNDEQSAWAYVNEREYRYYDKAGKLIEVTPHSFGAVPATDFRLQPKELGWAPCAGEGLVDGTLDAACVYAHMTWVRRVQAGYLTTIAGGDLGKKLIGGASPSEPELPLGYDGRPTDFAVDVKNRDAPIQPFIQHIQAIASQQAIDYGVPPQEVLLQTDSNAWGTYAINVRSERLAYLRRLLLPALIDAEKRLWLQVIAVARMSGHPLASLMPTPEQAEEWLQIEFPELAYISDPLKHLDLAKGEMQLGLASPLDYVQTRHPHLTREQARERLMSNHQERLELARMLRELNLPGDVGAGGDVVTDTQALGEQGGYTRAANAAAAKAARAADNADSR